MEAIASATPAGPAASPAGSAAAGDGLAADQDGASRSLNEDPYNLRAEEQALAECTVGLEVRRVWSETEMVRSFGGQMSPGTPDGMFETWDGALTCVQVVRVPLTAACTVPEMQRVLAQTVLTKVVKSQQWLRMSHASPEDFVIFCWLPFAVPGEVEEDAVELMCRVRQLDPRFSLRLRTPADTSALFPALFARHWDPHRHKSVSESDVSTFRGSEDSDEEGDEGACAWDLTWDWEEEGSPAALDGPGQAAGPGDAEGEAEEAEEAEEDDGPWEWDITWDWAHDWAAPVPSGAAAVWAGDSAGGLAAVGQQGTLADDECGALWQRFGEAPDGASRGRGGVYRTACGRG